MVTNGKANSKGRSRKGGKAGPIATVKFGSASVPIYFSESNGRKRYFIAHYRKGKRIRKAFTDIAAAKKSRDPDHLQNFVYDQQAGLDPETLTDELEAAGEYVTILGRRMRGASGISCDRWMLLRGFEL